MFKKNNKPKKKTLILQYYEPSKDISQIAKECSCSVRYVQNILYKNNLFQRPITILKRDIIIQLVKEGKTSAQIQKIVNCTRCYVRNICKKYNLTIKSNKDKIREESKIFARKLEIFLNNNDSLIATQENMAKAFGINLHTFKQYFTRSKEFISQEANSKLFRHPNDDELSSVLNNVYSLLKEGKTISQIAEMLKIKRDTVIMYRHRIKSKGFTLPSLAGVKNSLEEIEPLCDGNITMSQLTRKLNWSRSKVSYYVEKYRLNVKVKRRGY